MSIEAVAAVLDGVTDVDPTAKLVLVVLAEYARRGSALTWPSVPTIARRASVSERRVQKHLATLRAAGWIAIERDSHGGRGRDNTKVYRLNIEQMNGDAGVTLGNRVRVMRASPFQTRKGDADGTSRVMPVAIKGDADGMPRVMPASPEPVLTGTTTGKNRKGARERAQGAASAARPQPEWATHGKTASAPLDRQRSTAWQKR